MNTKRNSNWIPEILYEENSLIPFIEVPVDEKNPALLFIFINQKTGEHEPGDDGEDLPVYNMDLRQFGDLSLLAEKLSAEDYDKVRAAFGLESRAAAAKKGSEITKKIVEKVNGTKS